MANDTTILGDFMNHLKLRVIGMDAHNHNPIMDGWNVVRIISREEAVRLVNAPSQVQDKESMWVNHGYFVLEMLDKYNPADVVSGMTGVYLCDGKYMIIKKA